MENMKIKEEKASGLKRTYKVHVAAEDIEQKVKDKLLDMGKKAKIPGFRPGKAPLQVLQQRYEDSVRPDVLRDIIDDAVRQLRTEKKLRFAAQPDVKIDSYNEGESLDCTIELELLPDIQEIDLSKLSCQKLMAPVEDEEVQAHVQMIASNNKVTTKLETKRPARSGDTLVIDFNGRTLAGPIKGGSGKGVQLELGSGTFIPGFEEQLVGVNEGDKKSIEVTFPKDYQAPELAGQHANFEVVVHDILETIIPEVDEAFAKNLGLKNLEGLKKAVKEHLEKENERLSFLLLKKQILDSLDRTELELPKSLVEAEFNIIWQEYRQEHQHDHGDCADESCTHPEHKKDKKKSKTTEEEKERKEYQEIAERRVRLGLILAEIGKKHKVEVTRSEVESALFEQARRYPGQEKKLYEFYQKHPQAMQSLRAPIFEDKVIGVIIKEAAVKEKKVSQKELEAAVKEITEEE